MPRPLAAGALFCKRLRAARVAAGLSQKQLGIRAEIDPFVASTRINRYETGVHQADLQTANRLAEVLGVPLAYLFAQEDRLARMILVFPKLSRTQQERLLEKLEEPSGN
jgi:transcriptional regulator with XRE-family HTH domain